jgi:serine/threonine protein phosphatase PrpC
MGIRISWRGVQGSRTRENRDWCGVGVRETSALCVVLDGSTSGSASGEFAHQIAEKLVNWFVAQDEVNSDKIIDRMRELHGELVPRFRQDSASIIVAHVQIDGAVLLLNAGDCLAGICEAGGINWRTRPHTLANPIEDLPIAEIAASPLRHRLTRSFRSREFMVPDVYELKLQGDEALILATDGLWATLDPKVQIDFLADMDLAKIEFVDDCSGLSLRFDPDAAGIILERHTENFIAPPE